MLSLGDADYDVKVRDANDHTCESSAQAVSIVQGAKLTFTLSTNDLT